MPRLIPSARQALTSMTAFSRTVMARWQPPPFSVIDTTPLSREQVIDLLVEQARNLLAKA